MSSSTNGAHVEVAATWGPPAVVYATALRPLINGALVKVSARGIEEVIDPPTRYWVSLSDRA